MKSELVKNEREWTGQLVSWIKSEIESGRTSFQDVTNDSGIKASNSTTLFPDILLFTDKISGVVFNGWELKFPDTDYDDKDMLENALEKARRLQSNSFVTWNGTEAAIWLIDTDKYDIETLKELKHYEKLPTIRTRKDLATPINYAKHELELRNRAKEILHDLESLYQEKIIKPAINISSNIADAIKKVGLLVVPQFKKSIIERRNTDNLFRKEFNKWKILERSTINLLSNSSRRQECIDDCDILAKFTFYNLIGKILFYLTLSSNLPRELDSMKICEEKKLKEQLEIFFNRAKAIDYQAIFQPYFTDDLEFSIIADTVLKKLISIFLTFDFSLLPTQVIANILSNLIPQDEKQKFGQYFTPEVLANLVAYSVFKKNSDIFMDPTSGTGTFLNSFYRILKHYGITDHSQILNQIWGNDISHFPAMLSVINLYKQDVAYTDNFPKIIRDDFFNLEVGIKVVFPDPYDHNKHIEIPIPEVDGIASNFPFIQQEDIPKNKLVPLFKQQFQIKQKSFLKNGLFEINERADYFTYCVYNSIRFLKKDGCLAAITSNAWLGKEYGFQFKQFLLDNFHLKYIIKSNAEHWFTESQVSTIFFVAERNNYDEPTRFVTINFRLEDYFDMKDVDCQISQIEDFYAELDNCNLPQNGNWHRHSNYNDAYIRNDGLLSVCIISKNTLQNSISTRANWSQFFISAHLLESFDSRFIKYHGKVVNVFRGERTGWNQMFIMHNRDIETNQVSPIYLKPYLKRPSDLDTLQIDTSFNYSLLICNDKLEDLDQGTRKWIQKFKDAPNKNNSNTISEANKEHKPFWYSLRPKFAHIVTAINPYERCLFCYSTVPFAIDQRLIAMSVSQNYDVEFIAALLNSVITFMTIELRGTSRHLGALDLNANYFKEAQFLNPDLITTEEKENIKQAFQKLKNRKIGSFREERQRTDRKNFDRAVFRAYKLDEGLVDNIYDLLDNLLANRVNLKNK